VRLGDYVVHDFTATVVGGDLRAGDDAADVRWCDDEDVALLPLTPGLLDAVRSMESSAAPE
jgi:8-oxo-dGTP diphosphatase